MVFVFHFPEMVLRSAHSINGAVFVSCSLIFLLPIIYGWCKGETYVFTCGVRLKSPCYCSVFMYSVNDTITERKEFNLSSHCFEISNLFILSFHWFYVSFSLWFGMMWIINVLFWKVQYVTSKVHSWRFTFLYYLLSVTISRQKLGNSN